MIEIQCDNCGGDMDQPGYLLFSPPIVAHRVQKYHLCHGCGFSIENGILESIRNRQPGAEN